MMAEGLRQRKTGAQDIGRPLGDDERAGQHHDLENLCLGRKRCGGKRRRRDAEARDQLDFVIDDQLLREARGIVGVGAVILNEHFDLALRDDVEILTDIELDRVVELLAGGDLSARRGNYKLERNGS